MNNWTIMWGLEWDRRHFVEKSEKMLDDRYDLQLMEERRILKNDTPVYNNIHSQMRKNISEQGPF